jgi:hypothetical protein
VPEPTQRQCVGSRCRATGKRGRGMICDECTWGDCESCPLDEYPTNSEIDMLGVGDR